MHLTKSQENTLLRPQRVFPKLGSSLFVIYKKSHGLQFSMQTITIKYVKQVKFNCRYTTANLLSDRSNRKFC
jgi:hypothetical protein